MSCMWPSCCKFHLGQPTLRTEPLCSAPLLLCGGYPPSSPRATRCQPAVPLPRPRAAEPNPGPAPALLLAARSFGTRGSPAAPVPGQQRCCPKPALPSRPCGEFRPAPSCRQGAALPWRCLRGCVQGGRPALGGAAGLPACLVGCLPLAELPAAGLPALGGAARSPLVEGCISSARGRCSASRSETADTEPALAHSALTPARRAAVCLAALAPSSAWEWMKLCAFKLCFPSNVFLCGTDVAGSDVGAHKAALMFFGRRSHSRKCAPQKMQSVTRPPLLWCLLFVNMPVQTAGSSDNIRDSRDSCSGFTQWNTERLPPSP